MSALKKIVLTLAIVFTTALGTAYFVGMAYFQTHYKIGTVINGFQCSMQTAEEAEALMSRNGESYALEIHTRNNGIEKISAEEVGLSFIGQKELIDVLTKQDYKLWFLPETEEVTLPTTAYQLDDTKLEEACAALECMQDMTQAQTAHVVETSGVYQVAPSVRGTELDKEKTKSIIETALRQWRPSVDLEETGCYIDAEAADEEALQANTDLLNSIQDTIITYDFGDRKEVIDFDVIANNFIAEDASLDLDLIKDYLAEIADTYDTVGIERKFVTYDERTVSIQGGDYGWVMDIDATAEELVELIKAQTIDVVEPKYTSTAASRDKNDVGRSYLEIDMANREAVLYIEGTPQAQVPVHLGTHVEQGMYSVKGKDETAILFETGSVYPYEEAVSSGFSGTDDIIGISASGVADGSIAIEGESMSMIYENMDESWPIIIYS